MNLKELATQYFETFSNQNIEGLRLMFADNVTLADWEASAEGMENVLTANQKIFDAVESIIVTPLTIYEANGTVIAELSIEINNGTEPTIRVCDVIDFDENGKILNIRAYLGG